MRLRKVELVFTLVMDQKFFFSQIIVHGTDQLLWGLDFGNLTSKGSKNGHLGMQAKGVIPLGYAGPMKLQAGKSPGIINH